MPPAELTEFDADIEPRALPEAEQLMSFAPEAALETIDVAATTSECDLNLSESACEKCETPRTGGQGWCRRCGWYPRLATFVELDPWDREDLPQPAPKSKLDICKTMIPLWAWKLMGGVAAVLIASFLLRLMLPQHGNIRFVWTVGQMLVGGLIFCGAHLACYIFAIMHNDRYHLLDIVLKPVAIWITVLRELPTTFWQTAVGAWGVTAILGGLLIGGLADKDLLDWGGTPARYNLTKAIADRAQELAANASSDKSLQESIEDFAGKAKEPIDQDEPQPPGKPKLPVDCLILGFKPLGDHDFYHLILAADVGGKLQYVGTVSDGISSEVRAQLNRRMAELRQPNPFIPLRIDGKWIRPALTCKVKAKRWSDENRLVDPVFEELLVDVDSQH
ncbi:MAG: hypothetical protein IT427_12195 [Pirellulales bacterium]|nr:hypothetical protein [Pirellulales bacterium]